MKFAGTSGAYAQPNMNSCGNTELALQVPFFQPCLYWERSAKSIRPPRQHLHSIELVQTESTMPLTKSTILCVFSLFVVPVVVAAPGQTSAAGCSAITASRATISGVEAIAGTAIFSGELLETSYDGSVMVQCGTVRLAVASDSSIRVFQTGTKTSVELERGKVIYSTGGRSEDLALYSLDAEIIPDTKQPTIGQIELFSSCNLSVQSTKGAAAVKSEKETKIVEESKAYDITPKLGVTYSDNWHPVPADYPDFPRQAEYHKSHNHVSCVASRIQNARTDPELFRAIPIVAGMAGAGYEVWRLESESPYKP